MKVSYLRYFGERPNGTIIIKSVKGNSPLRIFEYKKGMNLRVGPDVDPIQVKFLTRNHKDLFRVVEEEIVPEDILYAELFKFLPKIAKDLDYGAAAMIRKLAEVAMLVLGVDFSPDDPEQALEVLLNRLVEAYSEDIASKVLVSIFYNTVADRAETSPEPEVEDKVTKPTTLKFGSTKGKPKAAAKTSKRGK